MDMFSNLVGLVIGVALTAFIFGSIFRKAGYSGWLALLIFIPLVNIGTLLWFATTTWPLEKGYVDKGEDSKIDVAFELKMALRRARNAREEWTMGSCPQGIHACGPSGRRHPQWQLGAGTHPANPNQEDDWQRIGATGNKARTVAKIPAIPAFPCGRPHTNAEGDKRAKPATEMKPRVKVRLNTGSKAGPRLPNHIGSIMSPDLPNLAAAEVLRHYPRLPWSGAPQPLGNRGGFSGARLWRLDGPAGPLCLRLAGRHVFFSPRLHPPLCGSCPHRRPDVRAAPVPL